MAGIGLLVLWAVFVVWAVRVLRPAGRYALTVIRRERRPRVQLAIAALTVLADLFGPILGLIPRTVQLGTVGVGYLVMVVLAVTAAVYSRRRSH